MKTQVAVVLLLAVCALATEQKPSEGRDKRGALLAYSYPAAYSYPYYSPYAYSPYYSAAYYGSPYTSAAYVASPYSAAYTAYYK